MKSRAGLLLAVALALPLAGLVASWAATHSRAQQGTDWDVPIRGYDPRDLLRGHYITFQYDWPGLKRQDSFSYLSTVCIKGKAPVVERAVELVEQPSLAAKGCDAVAIATATDYSNNGLSGGMYFVPQAKAKGYEDRLRDPRIQTFVTLRIRDDGVVRPTGLKFRPRPGAPPTSR